jgi:hypothetical protein
VACRGTRNAHSRCVTGEYSLVACLCVTQLTCGTRSGTCGQGRRAATSSSRMQGFGSKPSTSMLSRLDPKSMLAAFGSLALLLLLGGGYVIVSKVRDTRTNLVQLFETFELFEFEPHSLQYHDSWALTHTGEGAIGICAVNFRAIDVRESSPRRHSATRP